MSYVLVLLLLLLFYFLSEIHCIKSSRNTFEHFRDSWYSVGRILPDGVYHIFKTFSPDFDIVRHKWFKKCCWYRRVTRSKFHTEDPQKLDATESKLVPVATWRPGFVHPWCKWIYVYECTVRPRDTAEVRNTMVQCVCVCVLRHAALLRYDTIRYNWERQHAVLHGGTE